jgi:hypothetical protein
MKPHDLYDIIGGILIIALVAVFLTKKNTARDVAATGNAFTGALTAAEKG